jgi:two-component system, NtrC family, response regulator PilR
MSEQLAVIVSEDPVCRRTLANVLEGCGLDVVFTSSVRESRDVFSRQSVCLTICEEKLADGDFRDVLRESESAAGWLPVIVFSRVADWSRCLDAMRQGAFDYLGFPCHSAEIERVVGNGLLEYLNAHNHVEAARA